MLNAAILDQRPRRPPPRRSLSLVLALSAILHALALLVLVLLVPDRGAPPNPGEPGPAMAMVFSGGATTPAPTTPEMNLLPPEMQQQEVPPPLPSHDEPAPFHLPARAYARPPHAPPNPFAHQLLLGFGSPRSAGRQGPTGRQKLDLSVGPVIRGGQMEDAVAHIASPDASADWSQAVYEWIASHKPPYPEQAAENGEDGTTVVVATIARDGRVKSVQLISSAGSQWLDLTTLGIFQGQKLPPFTPDMKDTETKVELNMEYVLTRH